MTKNITKYAVMISISALLTSCKLVSYPDAAAPCGDPLEYYNELATKSVKGETESAGVNKNTDTTKHNLSTDQQTDACTRLHEAIRLSMPDSSQQDDKKSLVLLKKLKQSGELSESDQRFNDMLLQHVSQRQGLRNMIGSQDERLKKTETQLDETETQLDKTETQLDQLKDIEVEIDKKERSVPAPASE